VKEGLELFDSLYRSRKSKAWIKVKNPKSPAATRAIGGTFRQMLLLYCDQRRCRWHKGTVVSDIEKRARTKNDYRCNY
jgi:hypothetical protein